MTAVRSQGLPLALAAVFLVVALSGQYVGDRAVGTRSSTATVDAIGRASTSYLTGIRTYAAAVLWNRIDPVMHGYYAAASLEEQTYMLSTVALVEWLDPLYPQAYYVGAWILVRNGKVAEGMTMARQGVERIPDSGMCRASYAQLLLLESKDLPAAVEQAKIALGPSIQWTDASEQLDSYASIEQILRQAGDVALADQVRETIDRIDATVQNSAPADIHDHNGDGVPDH